MRRMLLRKYGKIRIMILRLTAKIKTDIDFSFNQEKHNKFNFFDQRNIGSVVANINDDNNINVASIFSSWIGEKQHLYPTF